MSKFERVEPVVANAYRKDPKDEQFLNRLNTALATPEVEEYELLPELYPTLHIIGVPRSGTTLLSQLLASCTDLGYINNLIARFWAAPVYGIRLSKTLFPPGMNSSFVSQYGRTSAIAEPHEFGYFWSSLLRYREMVQKEQEEEGAIDWERLKLVLLNMSHAFGRPIVFKSFLLGWHVVQMQERLPKTCWLYIKRDPLDTALSILELRRDFLGSQEKWASLKPKEYQWLKDRPYWQQVAGQVYYLEQHYRTQLAQINKNQVLQVTYQELCNNPSGVLEQVVELVKRQGSSVTIQQAPPQQFTQQTYRYTRHPDAERIAQALQTFYRQDYDKAA